MKLAEVLDPIPDMHSKHMAHLFYDKNHPKRSKAFFVHGRNR